MKIRDSSVQSLKSRVVVESLLYFSSQTLKDLLQGTRLLVGVSVTSSPICDNDSEPWRTGELEEHVASVSLREDAEAVNSPWLTNYYCDATTTTKRDRKTAHIENPNKSINPNEFLLRSFFPLSVFYATNIVIGETVWANHHNQSGQKHYLLCIACVHCG